MKKTMVFLIFLVFIAGCKLQEMPKKGSFCGDNVCQDNEKESGCKPDCGGFGGITKKQCTDAKGSWNDCGSPCAGASADYCIEVCQQQCECGGIAGFKCPEGFKCRLSGKIADEMGVCVKE